MQQTRETDRLIALSASASAGFVAEMLGLYGRLINGRLADTAVVGRLLAADVAEMRVWLDEAGAVTGALIFLLLSPAGMQALVQGAFDPLEPSSRHLAGERSAAAVYGWACAGATPTARRAVMQTWSSLTSERFAALPFFARGATEAGRLALVERLKCLPVDGTDGLYRAAPPVFPRRRAA